MTINYCNIIDVKWHLLAEAKSGVGIDVVPVRDTSLHLLRIFLSDGLHCFCSTRVSLFLVCRDNYCSSSQE